MCTYVKNTHMDQKTTRNVSYVSNTHDYVMANSSPFLNWNLKQNPERTNVENRKVENTATAFQSQTESNY